MMTWTLIAATAAGAALALGAVDEGGEADGPVLRAGLIGLDTSHVIAFTRAMNAPDAEGPLARVRVVAGYPGGSPDIPASRDRVEGFTAQLRDEYGVEIVDSIDALLERVDVVLLESVDGRPHLEQARPVIAAGKPLFIDKPLAGSLADAIAIFAMAEEAGVPCFSSSSLRFRPEAAAVREGGDPVVGAMTYGPCEIEPHHPDLFWYGVHGVELLYALMGTGCATVSRTQTDGVDLVVGAWADGRVGTYRGIRAGKAGFGATVFREKGIEAFATSGDYGPLVERICTFFVTGEPPVSHAETLELFAFMEAADESKRRGGAPVSIVETLEEARRSAAAEGGR